MNVDPAKVNLNQNLWALVISLSALGFSEYFHLEKLECISYVISILTSISVILTLVFYTLRYCKNKA